MKKLFRIRRVKVSKDIEVAKTRFLEAIDSNDSSERDVDLAWYRLLYSVNVNNMRYNKIQFYMMILALVSNYFFLIFFLWLNRDKLGF